MMRAAMAVAEAVSAQSARAEHAREARLFRFLALVVDSFILGAVTFVVNSVYGVTQPTSGLTIGGPYATTVAWPWLTLVGILYFAIPEAMFGATPGKAWARLRVVRLDGRPLSVGSVIVRNLLKPVDWLPVLYLLGGVLVGVTRGRQRLGDLAAGTTVVYRHRAMDPGATRSSSPTARRRLLASLLFLILFTAVFDYFGRPPLVIAGLYNAHFEPMANVTSYSLGPPSWRRGEVSYPITLQTFDKPGTALISGVQTCSGTITLDWGWLGGWTSGASGWSCSPAP